MHASKTFSKCYRKLAVILGICSVLLSMASTEFCEAVAYALRCVGLKDLTLKPKQNNLPLLTTPWLRHWYNNYYRRLICVISSYNNNYCIIILNYYGLTSESEPDNYNYGTSFYISIMHAGNVWGVHGWSVPKPPALFFLFSTRIICIVNIHTNDIHT